MSLKTVYKPYFKIGAAVSRRMLEDPVGRRHILEQYQSLTCENDMKPEMLLDKAKNQADPNTYRKAPAVSFASAIPYLDFARENGIQMRGHTLVWYSQTPDWFFRENYEDGKSAPLADRETMLARMESYICSVLTFVQTNYPGVIYAWDVVNEAILENGFRTCLWLQTVGDDYVEKAFEFAAKYADKNVRLYYNDYDTYFPWKQELICRLILQPLQERQLIHGVGMQSHLKMEVPDAKDYWNAVCRFGQTGLEVQVTELDIHNPENTPAAMQALAERYRQIFTVLLKAKVEQKADITAVTLWGIRDEESWLEVYGQEHSYPLLFHGTYEPKAAYEAVVSVPASLKSETME